VAANLSLNERRRAWDLPLEGLPAQSRATLEARDALAGADTVVEQADKRRRLRDAVATLAPRQRAVVVLRYYGDCSLDEIATALGCRSGTVRATLHQALNVYILTTIRRAFLVPYPVDRGRRPPLSSKVEGTRPHWRRAS
jgi:RNA polymerase sigma factor (sigma-70 family)